MGLLTNAIDALTPLTGASVPLIRKPTITITTDVTDSGVRIRMADNGMGMDKKVCRQIFDPFFTTKPVGMGTGLGLSISYKIITESHHGNLWCDSEVNGGTKFVIELPIKQAEVNVEDKFKV